MSDKKLTLVSIVGIVAFIFGLVLLMTKIVSSLNDYAGLIIFGLQVTGLVIIIFSNKFLPKILGVVLLILSVAIIPTGSNFIMDIFGFLKEDLLVSGIIVILISIGITILGREPKEENAVH